MAVVTSTESIGPWLVTSTYDPEVSKSGPVEITIRPAEGANPRDLAGGISTTVLREIRPNSGVGQPQRLDVSPLLADAGVIAEQLGTADDGFLARVAAAYSEIAQHDHNPSGTLARALGKAQSTVKAYIGSARKRGLLTPAAPHRRGGTLTERGIELVNQGVLAAGVRPFSWEPGDDE